MFQELQCLILVSMVEVYTKEMRTCLYRGGEIDDFPQTDVFKMIIKEVGTDTRLLYYLALNERLKALLYKITRQIRYGEFVGSCAGKRHAVLRSMLRFSRLLDTAV